MKNTIVLGLFAGFICMSCASEKITTLSPIGKVEDGFSTMSYGARSSTNIHAAEITNLIASFPKLRNDAANNEINKLKTHLKNYIYALDSYNMIERAKILRKVESSYKNVQKLRKYLNPDDDQIINRYLVRIKTNISSIEATFDDTSISTIK